MPTENRDEAVACGKKDLLNRLKAAMRREDEEREQTLDVEAEELAELSVEMLDEQEIWRMLEESENPARRLWREQEEAEQGSAGTTARQGSGT